METKIPYDRFRGEQYDKDGDVLGEMQAVSIEYLQGLSRNELDTIPMAWLNDWARVSGLAECKDAQDWLSSLKERRERPRPLQIAKKQSAIIFIGCIDRRNKYNLKFRGRRMKICELYDGFCLVEGKRFTLTDEQMSRFRKVYDAFNNDFEKAKNNHDGFHCVTKDGYTVYFRRLQKFDYQFISKFANGDVRQDKMIINDRSVEFNFLGLESYDRLWCSRHDNPRIDDDFILLNTDDEYLSKEIKYICNKATKEDMEYLSSIDGFRRLYVDKEIYGMDDIDVTKVEKTPEKYLNGCYHYTLYFTKNGKEYSACYYDLGDDEIYVRYHAKSAKIQITKKLKKVINKMIDELHHDE